MGVPTDRAVIGLRSVQLSPWRMEFQHRADGGLLINDAYNANAVSTESALRSLARVDARRRVAVLGLMAELGDHHDDDHRAMAGLADELGIELLAFREPAYGRPVLETFDDVVEALGELGPGVAVLVKASRVAGLERLAERLLG